MNVRLSARNAPHLTSNDWAAGRNTARPDSRGDIDTVRQGLENLGLPGVGQFHSADDHGPASTGADVLSELGQLISVKYNDAVLSSVNDTELSEEDEDDQLESINLEEIRLMQSAICPCCGRRAKECSNEDRRNKVKSYTTRQLKRPRSMTGTLELWVGDLGDGGDWVLTQDGYYNRAVKPDSKKMRADDPHSKDPTFPTKTPASRARARPPPPTILNIKWDVSEDDHADDEDDLIGIERY